MTFVAVKQAGAIGVNKDLSAPELPIGAWTDALNVSFRDGYAYQSYGYSEIYATPPVIPYHVCPVTVAGVRKWIYAGAAKMYTVDAAGGTVTHTNITRQTTGVDVDYTGTINGWTSCVLSGVPILNNGTDAPQQWLLTGKATALSNWPASTTCKSLRVYKNSLIAINVTESSTNYPFMIRWSTAADPGSVPASWDYTSATVDAGRVDVSDSLGGELVDGLALRDSFMLYAKQAIFRMDYTGGAFVYRISKVLGASGVLNKNCIVEIPGGYHCVFGADDVYVHDGTSPLSILDKQTRRFLFASLDVDYAHRAFVFKNPWLNSVYICYPSAGNTTCNRALVYNYIDKTCGFQELPSLLHAMNGAMDSSLSQQIDADDLPIDSDDSAIDASDFTPDISRVMMAPNTTKLYQLDSSVTFDGTNISSYMERRGLHFDAPDKIKTVRGIRPRISGNTGYTVNVQVGWSDDPYSDPTYSDAVPYTIGTTVSCDTFASGRYLALKISSGTAYQYRVDSLYWDVNTKGSW